MKIIQINTFEHGYDSKGKPILHTRGLGDDGKLYKWSNLYQEWLRI